MHGGVKSTETRVTEFYWKIEIGLYLAITQSCACYIVSVLNTCIYRLI